MRREENAMKNRIWRAAVALAWASAVASLIVVPVVSLTDTVKADAYSFMANVLSRGNHVGRSYVADDSSVAIVVKYVGSGTSGLVAVAANGDITFTDGVSGSEVANTDFECLYQALWVG